MHYKRAESPEEAKMAQIQFKGVPVNTCGSLPKSGEAAPDFCLTGTDLSEVTLSSLKGSKVVLNIFPSIDTDVCASSVRRFNVEAGKLEGVKVLCVSLDLPFAQGRFCGAEGLNAVITVSAFRAEDFGRNYGVLLMDGPLQGLLARAVVVIDGEGSVVYSEQVPEITQEPDYDSALAAL